MEGLGGCCYSSAMSDGWKRSVFHWLLLWTMILGAASLRLTITPDHLDGGVSGANFRVVCNSSEPLTRCQFRWRDIYNNDGPIMDLSEGVDTPIATNYSYSGTGLDKKQCGISLNRPPGVQRWVVGCRVRSLTSEWQYAQMTLFAHLKGATSVTQSPRVVTVPPGGSATLSCQSDNSLLGCVFRLPNGSSALPPNRLRGTGACSVALAPATEDINGFAWCRAWRAGYDEWRAFAVVVATPPSVPVLAFSTPAYAVGDVLRVTCSVPDALPAANMTWYLDDTVVRQDHANEARAEPWRWPFERQAIAQTFTRRLEAGDAGRTLACVVRQIEGEEGVRAQYTIDFHTLPTVVLDVSSGPYKEGESLSATCTVSGVYPLSEVAWFLGPDSLAADANRSVVSGGGGAYILRETVTTRTLAGEDNNREVVCVAGGLVRRAETINVLHPPRISQQLTKEHLKFKVGSPGVAVVEFRANPSPVIYWTFDQVNVREGYADVTRRFQAAFMSMSKNNPGSWVAELFIDNVTLDDLRTSFFLNARNKLGEEFFRAVNFDATEPPVVSVQPKLLISPLVDHFPVGATIRATCLVTSNRPVPIITWTLSNLTITEGVGKPILTEGTDGEHTIIQAMTLQVQQKDDGSQIACSAWSQRTLFNISVMYPPKEFLPIIEQYGFEVGKPGGISVEISANPQPTVKWDIGGITIREDEFDSSKRFHAVRALARRRGEWVAKLFVTNITREDINAPVTLTARNPAGSTTYHVRLFSGSRPIESTTPVETTPAPATTADESAVYDDVVATVTDSGVESTSAESLVAGPVERPEATYIIQGNYSSYRILGIANSIAILLMVFVATMVYLRLLRRLSQANGGFADTDRAPIYMDNLYYDQMHGNGGQCTIITTNQQDAIGCE